MILWLTGNTGSGKSTLARKLAGKGTVILDGDSIREETSNFDLSESGRRKHCENVFKMALEEERNGKAVVVAVICPYEDQREKFAQAGAKFIYLPGGHETDRDHPYEIPQISTIVIEAKPY